MCWQNAIYAGVNPHYMVAVAEMRSGVKNDADTTRIGPFRLLQAEWDADWNGAALGYQYDPGDISNWRSQCAMFALMVRPTMEQMGGGGGAATCGRSRRSSGAASWLASPWCSTCPETGHDRRCRASAAA